MVIFKLVHMKNNSLFLILLATSFLVASSTEEVRIENISSNEVFTTGFESNYETRTYVDDKLNLYWSEQDCISVFSNTYNQKYVFNGKNGDNSGTFTKVVSEEFSTGNTLDSHFSVYPYFENTKISYDGIISLELPKVQTYKKGTFGDACNVMLAVTADVDDRFLFFKNVCGFIKLPIYGNIMVKRIEIFGNNYERISGQATIIGSHESDPSITMSTTANNSVVLDCPETGIAIGATENTAHSFWFVLPPTFFSNGIKFIVTDTEGNEYTLTSNKEQYVKRNVCLTLPAQKISDGTLEDPIELESSSYNNCYIISHSGYFKFPIGSYSGNSAFLLWNENGESDITNVKLNNGFIYFKKNGFNEGNAVISLKADDEIVWSWHIWSTDTPRDININGSIWMDRNLGATSTTPEDPGVYGLAYNAGNPFPFPGPKYDTYTITTSPSVPDGWYVAEGYGFYRSDDIPKPSRPMQLCSKNNIYGESVYFKNGLRQGPKGYYVPSSTYFLKMIGEEPTIKDKGAYLDGGMYIPCINYNRSNTTSGLYLCSGIYNTAAVDANAVLFKSGHSKETYCQGTDLMPIRCHK